MRTLNDIILSGDSSGSINGAAVDSENLISCTAQCYATGTVDGTVKLQGSNDVSIAGNLMTGFAPTFWTDIPSATATLTDSTAKMIPFTNLNYQYVRAVYTAGTATGAVTVRLKALGF